MSATTPRIGAMNLVGVDGDYESRDDCIRSLRALADRLERGPSQAMVTADVIPIKAPKPDDRQWLEPGCVPHEWREPSNSYPAPFGVLRP